MSYRPFDRGYLSGHFLTSIPGPLFIRHQAAISTTYTVLTSDFVLSVTGVLTAINIPVTNNVNGRALLVHVIPGGTSAVITPAVPTTIDGAASLTLTRGLVPDDGVLLLYSSARNNWDIILDSGFQ